MFKRSFVPIVMLVVLLQKAEAQVADTLTLAKQLRPAEVTAYFGSQPALTVPGTVTVLGQERLEALQHYSLLPAFNSVPGVRMEERSPGSYRLSIRGNLLRSPYGIRNIKIYLNDFLLTDAGGNTYLGSLDPGSTTRAEILKGPEASIFGANTGGVILLSATARMRDTSAVRTDISAGSYGLFHQKLSLDRQQRAFSVNINEAWQRSDGYRQNSSMDRKYAHIAPRWYYSPQGRVEALVMYSDVLYRTPGGLTEEQILANRRSARPPSATTPGSIEQKAGVINKTFFGGLSHEYRFSRYLRQVISFTAAHTDFTNSFITNYEERKESSLGLRTYLEFKDPKPSRDLFKAQAGLEAQRTRTDISNYGNRMGVRDTIQDADDIAAVQKFFFIHLTSRLSRRLVVEAAASVNFYKYNYADVLPLPSPNNKRIFKEKLMPRVAASYQLHSNMAWRASASRGYSPPTIAEVRPSDNRINTTLEAETGWNYETGFRLSLFNNRIYWDGVVFSFDLKDAIVRRLNEGGNEYFVNAGGTKQRGLESQILSWLVPPRAQGMVRSLQIGNSYTYSSFYFRSYRNGDNDYSGNRLTGVPRHTVVTTMDISFWRRVHFAGQHNYTSKLPLNDGATVFAKSYHLIQAKITWSHTVRNADVSLYAGGDNLLNQNYSLGNDLNALRDRYFNPAPSRNFFAGVNVQF